MSNPRYWLMKSEEDEYSIRDLERDGKTRWVGVRNYEARNYMRDGMKPGDLILYYHSNAKPSGVVGVARVASEPYPDPTQFDPKSGYFDEKATEEEPRWMLVDVEFVEAFPRVVPLREIKARDELQDMVLVRRMRLSVQPVEAEEFRLVKKMAKTED
jgi:predicted RNA-binding protein with PUA-like domain